MGLETHFLPVALPTVPHSHASHEGRVSKHLRCPVHPIPTAKAKDKGITEEDFEFGLMGGGLCSSVSGVACTNPTKANFFFFTFSLINLS